VILPFSLVPFPGEAPPPGLAVTGAIGRRGEALSIRHTLAGDARALQIPPAEEAPGRRGRLWEGTCMELFLAGTDEEGYLEFNLSPSGHWNVYRFASCRRGMVEEGALSSLPLRVRREPGSLTLEAEVDLGRIFPPGRPLCAAVAAVVRSAAGGTTHWALAHTAPRPDFHRRDAFRIALPPSP
jgi:hypothetical protein